MSAVMKLELGAVLFLDKLPKTGVEIAVAPEITRLEIRAPAIEETRPGHLDLEPAQGCRSLALDGGWWMDVSRPSESANLKLSSPKPELLSYVLVRSTAGAPAGETTTEALVEQLLEVSAQDPQNALALLAAQPPRRAEAAVAAFLSRLAASDSDIEAAALAPIFMLFNRS